MGECTTIDIDRKTLQPCHRIDGHVCVRHRLQRDDRHQQHQVSKVDLPQSVHAQNRNPLRAVDRGGKERRDLQRRRRHRDRRSHLGNGQVLLRDLQRLLCTRTFPLSSQVFANHPKKTITAVASMGPKDTLVDIEIVHWKVSSVCWKTRLALDSFFIYTSSRCHIHLTTSFVPYSYHFVPTPNKLHVSIPMEKNRHPDVSIMETKNDNLMVNYK